MDEAFGTDRYQVLGDIVAAIEIFNEVDEVGWYRDEADPWHARPELAGADWGKGTALAGQADAAGWHAWSSSLSPVFQGMGLRKDAEQVSEEAGDEVWAPLALDEPTSVSETRPSWYAFQRLSQQLGNQGLSGRMVLPAVESRDALMAYLGGTYPTGTVAPGSPRHRPWKSGYAVVVLEFRLGYMPGDRSYLYLVFIDPVFLAPVFLAPEGMTKDMLDASGALVQFKSDRGGVFEWTRIATLPNLSGSLVFPDLSLRSDECNDLPSRSAVSIGSGDPFFLSDASAAGHSSSWQDLFFDTSHATTTVSSGFGHGIRGSSPPAPVRDLAPALIWSPESLIWQVP